MEDIKLEQEDKPTEHTPEQEALVAELDLIIKNSILPPKVFRQEGGGLCSGFLRYAERLSRKESRTREYFIFKKGTQGEFVVVFENLYVHVYSDKDRTGKGYFQPLDYNIFRHERYSVKIFESNDPNISFDNEGELDKIMKTSPKIDFVAYEGLAPSYTEDVNFWIEQHKKIDLVEKYIKLPYKSTVPNLIPSSENWETNWNTLDPTWKWEDNPQ